MSLIEKALRKNQSQTKVPPAPRAMRGAPAAYEGLPPFARTEPLRRIEIDLDRLRDGGILAPPAMEHQHANQVRAIKGKLLRAMRREPAPGKRVILVASSLPGEGKTFNSVNLALSMALEKDYRVVLVDGDVAKPNVSRLFGVESLPGLLDATQEGFVDVESLIVGTNLPGFDILPAGQPVSDTTERLSSTRMQDLVAELVARPDRIVVIDSPPLLVTTEAVALTQHAGQILLVVRANSTPRHALEESIRLLGERDGVGLLLNDVTESSLGGLYYGYRQHYGYRYGDAVSETPPPAAAPGPDA